MTLTDRIDCKQPGITHSNLDASEHEDKHIKMH